MVGVEVEEPSGVLVLRAQGFTPEQAQALGAHLVARASDFANEMLNKLAREQLDFALNEHVKVEARLAAARAELTDFQQTHALYDLDAQAQEQAGLVARLQTALAEAQAELAQLRVTMTNEAAAVVVARAKVNALAAQVRAQEKKLGTGRKSEDAVRWAQLRREVEFLETEWRTVQATVEKTRAESLRKVRSLVVLEPAQLPQEALRPQRLQSFFLWSLLTLLATGCVWLLRGLIQEQSWRY
jgi:capsular polysaccharide transport system permease protein